MERQCLVVGCNKAYSSKGYCVNHAYRARRYGDPLHPDQRSIKSGTRTHGLSYNKLYRVWLGMMERCFNPRHKSFKYYGAKGIRVCFRWISKENFIADMGEIPVGMQLERINSNSNYTPKNVRWATHTEQMRNRPSWNKLDMEKAREIRAAYASGKVTQYDLAEHYGCNQVLISKVVLGHNWKETH